MYIWVVRIFMTEIYSMSLVSWCRQHTILIELTSGMSFMSIKKRNGPKIDPCGTPVEIAQTFDVIYFDILSS